MDKHFSLVLRLGAYLCDSPYYSSTVVYLYIIWLLLDEVVFSNLWGYICELKSNEMEILLII